MINVLLADDQRLVCEGLCNLLKLQEDLCVVGVAHNGREAIDLAQSLTPDVLLLDIQMPEMDGLTAAFHLQQILPNLKILILTTFKNQDYLTQSLNAGAKGYILKNTPPAEIAQAIRLVHRGHTHFSPGVMEQLLPLLNTSLNNSVNSSINSSVNTGLNALSEQHNGLSPKLFQQLENLIDSNRYDSAQLNNPQAGNYPLAKHQTSKEIALHRNKSESSFLQIENLTRRELEIIKLIQQGYANREIAHLLRISEQTVKNHVSSILRRLNLRDRTQVALWATRML